MTAVLAVATLVLALPALAQDVEAGCVPASYPGPAIEVVEFGDVNLEVVEQSRQEAQERIIAATGADFRWVCDHAAIDADPADSAEEVRDRVLSERPDVGPRKYLTVAPITEQRVNMNTCGQGWQGHTDRSVAVVFNRCGQPLHDPPGTVGLHELMHTFGIGHINVDGDLMHEGRGSMDECVRTESPHTLDCENGDLYGMDLAPWLVRPSAAAAPETRVERIDGADRYLTSVKASRDGYPITSSVAYIASSAADALVASGMPEDGPVLLTQPDQLHPAVADELARLSPNRIVIVGGTDAVSDAVVTAIEDAVTTS